MRLVRAMAFQNLWNPTAPRRRGFQRVQVFEMGQIGPKVREESVQACLRKELVLFERLAWFRRLDLIRP